MSKFGIPTVPLCGQYVAYDSHDEAIADVRQALVKLGEIEEFKLCD